MKKRKELNSLLGNRRLHQNPSNQNVTDTLLSSSSDNDVYIAPTSSKYGMATKRISRSSVGGICTFRRFIRICLPICFLCLVAACIIACIGIVWMQVQLQTDLERIKATVEKLDGWHNSQDTKVNNLLKSSAKLREDINGMDTRENGVLDLANKLNSLQAQFDAEITRPSAAIVDVKKEVNELLDRIKSLEEKASHLELFVDESIKLQATLEDKVKSNKDEVNELKQEVKEKLSEDDVKVLVPKITSNIKSDTANVNASLHELLEKIQELETNLGRTEDKLSDVDHKIKDPPAINNEIINKVNKLYDKVFNSDPPQEQKSSEIDPEDGAIESKSGAENPKEISNDATQSTLKEGDEVHQAKYDPIPSHHTDTQIGDTTVSVTLSPPEESEPINGS